MVVDLRQLFQAAGEQIPVKYELDLSSYEINQKKPFITPLLVTGRVQNVAGIVSLDYSVSGMMHLSCDRCLTEFERKFSGKYQHILVTELETDDEEYIVVEDMLLDLDELVTLDVVLEYPTKILCSSECKGLCAQCGADLNKGDCGCKQSKGDPRFDVLNQLLT